MFDFINAQVATVVYLVVMWAEMLLILFLLSKASGEKDIITKTEALEKAFTEKMLSLENIIVEHDKKVYEQNKKLKALFYRTRDASQPDHPTGKSRKIDVYVENNKFRQRKDDKYTRFDEADDLFEEDEYKELKK